MKNIILYILLGFTVGAIGCSDENKLTPSDQDIYGYSVPQGEHDYDDKIVAWKDKYNFFALYKWVPRDLYWSPTGWSEAKENPPGSTFLWTNGWNGEPADEAYVGQQLDLIEKTFVSFYPDSTFRRCMPLKMLLCKKLQLIGTNGVATDKNVYQNFDHLAFSYGNESVLALTSAQKNALKLEFNLLFLLRLKSNGWIPVSELFYTYSDYSTNMTSSTYYARGFVVNNNSDKTNTDWQHYLEAILSTSYEDLTREVPASDRTFHGILNDTKDTKGLIKKKYKAMIDHFKQYGIDLQNIGNTSVN